MKKRRKTEDDIDPTVNFLNGRNYSPGFYTLLEGRKVLPAWQAKKQIIDLVKKH